MGIAMFGCFASCKVRSLLLNYKKNLEISHTNKQFYSHLVVGFWTPTDVTKIKGRGDIYFFPFFNFPKISFYCGCLVSLCFAKFLGCLKNSGHISQR